MTLVIPGQKFEILDPGLPAVVPGVTAALVMGTSSAGEANKVYSFTQPKDVVDTLGQGELPEALCYNLNVAGGPMFGVKLEAGIAGVAGAVAKVGTGTGTLTLGGAPYDAYTLKVLITKGGALGVAEFTFTLDGTTWSDVLTVPAGGSFAGIAGLTGLTLTFTGDFVQGDLHSATCTAPFYNPTNLADGMNAVLDSNVDFAFIQLTGEPATAAAGKILAAALDVHCLSLFNQARFVRAMLSVGVDQANSITEYAGYASGRVLGVYHRCTMLSSKPMAGWSVIERPFVNPVAARAAASLISTDLGRVASGALPGVVGIGHDEARSPMLDAKRFTTSRTVQGKPGYYITNGRLMSAPGSDFRYWQHGRCMDAACRTAWIVQSVLIGASCRTVGPGTIDPRDAARWEGPIRTALDETLMSPDDAEGTKGHVSGFKYSIDRTTNVLASDSIYTDVGIKPRGYAKFIYTRLSYTTNTGA